MIKFDVKFLNRLIINDICDISIEFGCYHAHFGDNGLVVDETMDSNEYRAFLYVLILPLTLIREHLVQYLLALIIDQSDSIIELQLTGLILEYFQSHPPNIIL